MTHPILRGIGIFVAAFGGQVEEIVGGIHQVNPALRSSTLVRDFAAVAGPLFAGI
jgi:hypothetical protein